MSDSNNDEIPELVAQYRKVMLRYSEQEAKVKGAMKKLVELQKEYQKTEDHLKAIQSVGQIIGEVLRQLDEERFIVKASSGPRYVVGCRNKIEKV